MKTARQFVFAVMLLVLIAFQPQLSAAGRIRESKNPTIRQSSQSARLTLNFNPDWKFTKSDPAGAAAVDFDDSAWRDVSLPHTYNDVDTFDDWSIPGHRGEQNQWGGRTWYRKTFNLPDTFRGKKVFIEFEGVRQVAEVYLNGYLLGVSKTGFTPFGFDLSPHLKFGRKNVLAVMCDNRFMKDPLVAKTAAALGIAPNSAPLSAPNPNLSQLSATVNAAIPADLDQLAADQIPWNNPHWHPAHGGIYRNVRLYVTDPLHITLPLYSFLKTAGPYVYATEISARSAKVGLEVPVANDRVASANVELLAELLDVDGKSVLTIKQAKVIPAGTRADFALSGVIANPRLWEPDYPHSYRVVFALRPNGKTVDTSEASLGIRAVRWDPAQGFFVNGHHLKLHGWGQKPTNEWPGLGAALPDWLHFYTLQQMKAAGGNFVRWGHSAAGPAQIAAGDRLGIIADQPGVDGESDTVGAAWQLRAMAFRDVLIYFRNNPSILIWEGGNQKVTREHAQELRTLMDVYDPHGGRAYAHRRADKITAEFMDIGIGTEGGREIASLPIVEGEYDREESPRRVWDEFSPPSFGYSEAKGQTYQLTSEQFAVNEVSQYTKKVGAPEHSGGGNWIFSDSTSGGRVAVEVARASGEVDGVRLPKEAYFVCAAMFRSDPQVHIIGHWTYPAGTKKTVYVASNAEEVELLVNGKSLGHGQHSDQYLFTFPDVIWEPGEIKAVAYIGGKPVATQAKHTAGPPVALKLTAMTAPDGLRADGSDIALIDVEAVDANGERVPTFQQRVDFSVAGSAMWRGGYNSGKIKSTNNLFLDLEAGINRVAVRAARTAGQITVRATSTGLKPASIDLTAKGFAARDGYAAVAPSVPVVTLPQQAPSHGDWLPAASGVASKSLATAGRFTRSFNYSGPSASIVYIDTNAIDGKNAYVDVDSAFVQLPAALAGADWIKTANRDSNYSAADLIELAVAGGTVISVAHDDRIARPEWLIRQFQPTPLSITVNGRAMKVFQRNVARDESLTLGGNTDASDSPPGNMYLVFINAGTVVQKGSLP